MEFVDRADMIATKESEKSMRESEKSMNEKKQLQRQDTSCAQVLHIDDSSQKVASIGYYQALVGGVGKYYRIKNKNISIKNYLSY